MKHKLLFILYFIFSIFLYFTKIVGSIVIWKIVLSIVTNEFESVLLSCFFGLFIVGFSKDLYEDIKEYNFLHKSILKSEQRVKRTKKI